MKLKMAKKILSFMMMLAVAMTMPGVANAIPTGQAGKTLKDSGQNKELGKKRARPEENDDEKNEEDQQAEKRLKVKENDQAGEKII